MWHGCVVTAGEDGAFRIFCPALRQPQVDAAFHLADGKQVAVCFDQHIVPGAMPGQKICRLTDHLGRDFSHPADALHLDLVLGCHGFPKDREARFPDQLKLRQRLLQPGEGGISPAGVQNSIKAHTPGCDLLIYKNLLQ